MHFLASGGADLLEHIHENTAKDHKIKRILKRSGPPRNRKPGLTFSKTFGICCGFDGFVIFGDLLAPGGADLFEHLWGLVISTFLKFGMV